MSSYLSIEYSQRVQSNLINFMVAIASFRQSSTNEKVLQRVILSFNKTYTSILFIQCQNPHYIGRKKMEEVNILFYQEL